MKFLLTLALAALLAACVTACGGGSPAPQPQLPQTASLFLQCNGAPSRVIVYLHSWGATHDEVRNYPDITNAPNACIVSPGFGEMAPNSIYGTQAALDEIDRAIETAIAAAGTHDVRMIAVSGGTAPASSYLDAHPGKVSKASLWFSIFDLQMLYETTDLQRLRTDMVTMIGHAPQGTSDADYRARSPSRQMGMIATPLALNIGTQDNTVPRLQTGMLFIHAQTFTVHEWPIGHSFGQEQAQEAMRQVLP